MQPSLHRAQLTVGDKIDVIETTKLYNMDAKIGQPDAKDVLVQVKSGEVLNVVDQDGENFIAQTGAGVRVLISRACDRSQALRLKKEAA